MQYRENIIEGLRSIKSNVLRTVLTAAIIALGIMALVGILTAIDGIQTSILRSFAGLGANVFDITPKGQGDRRESTQGVEQKVYPPISFKEAMQFKNDYDYPSQVSVSALVRGSVEVKHGSKKSNPIMRIMGVDVPYFAIKGYDFEQGRNFSNSEIQFGSNVAIIGQGVKSALFEKNEDPINAYVSFYGKRFKIIGVLEKEGSIGGGGGADRAVFVPVVLSSQFTMFTVRYNLQVAIDDPMAMQTAMSEATGAMRKVRRDPVGQESSFEIKRSETLADRLNEISGALKIGGFAIGFITLIGASIGLMNIMLVSVTERTREIGIRKAIGASPSKIRQQFLWEAIVICQLGGLAGVLLGILMGNLVATIIGEGGFIVPWLWIITGLIICVVVGIISGYYPAYKASKLDPIDSLRYE